jgi:cyclophilin family peptidyl-prolyl cis-trans isomerase
MGEITIKLNREKAPLTVQNFLSYAASRHYEGTVFHQVVKDQLVLGGGYDSEFVEKSAHSTVRNEADNGLSNVRGTISMARRPDSVDSATCQFFINLADNKYLDQVANDPGKADEYGYCVFGEIIEGLDVVEQIASSDIDNREVTNADQTKEEIPNVPKRTVMIKSVEHKKG